MDGAEEIVDGSASSDYAQGYADGYGGKPQGTAFFGLFLRKGDYEAGYNAGIYAKSNAKPKYADMDDTVLGAVKAPLVPVKSMPAIGKSCCACRCPKCGATLCLTLSGANAAVADHIARAPNRVAKAARRLLAHKACRTRLRRCSL